MSEPARQPRRARRERGAVAVEAALVTPLLLGVLLGIVEMSLLLRDQVAVTSAVRVGSRIASAAADAGPGTPATSPMLAEAAAAAIQRAGSAMPHDAIEFIYVYKANKHGFPGSDTNTTMPAACTTNCVKYVWNGTRFAYSSGGWVSSSINACVNESDTLGVYMEATHDWVTGMFGDGFTVTDRSVMRFEPLPQDSCKPGTPAAHR